MSARGAEISLDPSQRYYRDTNGQAVFLIGYYGWAAVPPGYTIDHPSQYAAMMQQGAAYKIDYIRISLGVNRFTASTNPPSWNGQPTPVPFAYVGNPARADLNQWDPVFWNGLKSQCATAQANGVIVHMSIFDGVELRGGSEAYRYANSFWNPANQTQAFYNNPDTNGNANIDEGGEFYRLADFNNNAGLGIYQRRLIEKTISETDEYPNIFCEVGNELLSADSAWYAAVINHMKTLTGRPVTQNGGGATSLAQGWAQHHANTPAEVKSNVAGIVGQGRPAWEDPDGPALSDSSVSADDLRRSAWYSFAGGAAGWGGFTVDFWADGSGLNVTKAGYYRNLQQFIADAGVAFWQMVPRHDLVGNNAENSCLASAGQEYVVYVLNDASVTLNLAGLAGSTTYRLYDPRTAAWTSPAGVQGGAVRTFNRPAGAEDWVIHVIPAQLAPLIAEVMPDPQLITPGTTYTQQLALVQGHPAPNWSLIQGPAGAQIDAGGLVSGWTPASFGDVVFMVQASSPAGDDTETWTVRVRSLADLDLDGDVDLSDFAQLQACLSGDGLLYAPGCEPPDVDGDLDVDATDFGAFLPCMHGAEQEPGC